MASGSTGRASTIRAIALIPSSAMGVLSAISTTIPYVGFPRNGTITSCPGSTTFNKAGGTT